MRQAPRRNAQAGFTLLEILVALVVLGFLVLALAEGVRFGLRAWDTETALVSRRTDMDGMERLLRELIAGANPGDPSEPLPFTGNAHTLTFVGRLPMSAASAGIRAFTRDAEFALAVDAKRRLVLRWRAHPHAERLTPQPPPVETVLLEGVEQITFGYELRPGEGKGWVETWSQPTLPLSIRITLAFSPEAHRHWPTIVASPMLSRTDQ
jgi:general secretion pathway protein J